MFFREKTEWFEKLRFQDATGEVLIFNTLEDSAEVFCKTFEQKKGAENYGFSETKFLRSRFEVGSDTFREELDAALESQMHRLSFDSPSQQAFILKFRKKN